jgi:GNAT superfamily N-acetyltransferase
MAKDTRRTAFDPTKVRVVLRHEGISSDIEQMRSEILRDEMQFISDEDLRSADDERGTHCCLFVDHELVGASLGIPAEQSTLPGRVGIEAEKFSSHYYVTRVMLSPHFRGVGLAPALIYSLFREGRILGRKTAIGLFDDTDAVPAHLTGALELKQIPAVPFTGYKGRTLALKTMIADISFGMHRCWNQMSDELRNSTMRPLLADEVIRTVLLETERFYDNPWFHRVKEGTLTRGQYVDFLSNNHQFVRWTTRILARIAGIAEDRELRNHYISHLSGEIDHELLIESDLRHLGADVNYVCNFMTPCLDVGHFMGIQESLVGFRADPILMLAVPIAIESLTAHLNSQFLRDLRHSIRNWGVAEPDKAMSYLQSHIPIDGGDDGHWARTAQVIQRFLRTEADTQRFVGTARMVITAMDRALRSYMVASELST